MIAGRASAMSKLSSPWDAVRNMAFVGLLALAGYWLVSLVISILAPESRYQPVKLVAPVAAPSGGTLNYDFSYNPFSAGDVVVADAAASLGSSPANDDAPETTLDLTLTGLRAGPNGSAFIQTPNGEADNFYVGDEVMNGVSLRDVRADHIVIDVNGQAQKLTSEDAKAAKRDARGASTNAPSGSLSTLKAVDAERFMSQVTLTPQLDRSMKLLGVSVSANSPGVKLSDYGLKNGDIITSIAGQSLTSGFPDPIAIRRAISPGRPVSVKLLRDGVPMSVTIG